MFLNRTYLGVWNERLDSAILMMMMMMAVVVVAHHAHQLATY